MSFNLRFHVGNTEATTAVVMFSTLDNANAVEFSLLGGSAIVGTITDIHADGDYIGTGKVSITGLSSSTKYTFTISQGSESYDGSFTTIPDNQNEDFSFAFLTCTNHQFAFSSIYSALADEIRNGTITSVFHIDDMSYVDTMNLTSLNNLVDGSGLPQDTGLVKDYATAWACSFGHEPKFANFTDADFQYCLRNASWYISGGDHMFENNHCRGQIGLGDYSDKGCPRDPAHTLPNLEANALTAWHSFIGNGNPATLGSGTDLHWGKEIGPLRFGLMDTNLYSEPYDGADTTGAMFGATQIGEVMTYLDVATVPFKCMLMETGFSRVGQPWREWWTTECDAWHTNDLVGNNLDSTDGWFFGLIGDNHTIHAASMDGGSGTGYWWFCPATTGGSASTNWVNTYALPPTTGNKTGKIRFFKHKESLTKNYASYMKITVNGSESPKRILCECKDINGDNIFSYELTAEAGNDNQWTNKRQQKIGF